MSSGEVHLGELPTLQTWGEAAGGDELTPELARHYGGGLAFPPVAGARPYVYANFVATLDGVVSFQTPGQAGGGTISGGDAGDRFVMGLLRASCDAVMVGAATLAPVPVKSLWLPGSVCPEGGELYRTYRAARGRRAAPLLVVVSGSGRVDLERDIFHQPALRAVILTSAAGARALTRAGADRLTGLTVRALPSGAMGLAPEAMLTSLATEFGVRHLLHEGGPRLFGEFLRAGAVDELFLTLAPRLAGRSPQQPRPGVVEGIAFPPANAPGGRLLSGKRLDDYLYLRYGIA